MVTALDTNILVALLEGEKSSEIIVKRALQDASKIGRLVICGAVFAELMASPRRTEAFLSDFCSDTGVSVDWSEGEQVWRSAGRAYARYAVNRRRQKSGVPRRILTDFVIGAHALVNRHSLLTADTRIYRTAFPKLKLVSI